MCRVTDIRLLINHRIEFPNHSKWIDAVIFTAPYNNHYRNIIKLSIWFSLDLGIFSTSSYLVFMWSVCSAQFICIIVDLLLSCGVMTSATLFSCCCCQPEYHYSSFFALLCLNVSGELLVDKQLKFDAERPPLLIYINEVHRIYQNVQAIRYVCAKYSVLGFRPKVFSFIDNTHIIIMFVRYSLRIMTQTCAATKEVHQLGPTKKITFE